MGIGQQNHIHTADEKRQDDGPDRIWTEEKDGRRKCTPVDLRKHEIPSDVLGRGHDIDRASCIKTAVAYVLDGAARAGPPCLSPFKIETIVICPAGGAGIQRIVGIIGLETEAQADEWPRLRRLDIVEEDRFVRDRKEASVVGGHFFSLGDEFSIPTQSSDCLDWMGEHSLQKEQPGIFPRQAPEAKFPDSESSETHAVQVIYESFQTRVPKFNK